MNAELESKILGKYAEMGFSLEEDNDHIVVLWFKDNMVAAFSQIAATQSSLRNACKHYLKVMTEATL